MRHRFTPHDGPPCADTSYTKYNTCRLRACTFGTPATGLLRGEPQSSVLESGPPAALTDRISKKRLVAAHVAPIQLGAMPSGDVLARIFSVAAKHVVALDLFGFEVLHRLEMLRKMDKAKFRPCILGLEQLMLIRYQ